MTNEKNTEYEKLLEQLLQNNSVSANAYEQQRSNVVDDMNERTAKAAQVQSAGSGYVDNSGGNASRSTAKNTNVTEDLRKFFYDASGDGAYQQALQALQQAQQNRPTYAGTYDKPLLELYDQIVNRDKFKYDLNGDMLYQQYKDQYVNLGQMAMRDSMGQAAALTGGYGSSYGQSVGQQQYDAYLQQLNDVVPELYGMALDQYNAEGDRLMQQYGMLGDLQNDEYAKYQDALDRYWQNVSYLQGQADDAYDRSYNNWMNAMQQAQAAEEKEYDRTMDAYNRLADLISSTGYEPTWQEALAAGMSPQQVVAYRNYYRNNQAAKTSYSSGSSGGSRSSGGTVTATTQRTPTAVQMPVNADAELQYLRKKGASDGELVQYLAEAVRGGQITQEQANTLEKKYIRADRF